jgi:hypothetical protein
MDGLFVGEAGTVFLTVTLRPVNNGLCMGYAQTHIGGLGLRQSAHRGNKIPMKLLHPRHGLILILLPFLAACGGTQSLKKSECPPIYILTTAEKLPAGKAEAARLTGVSVSCAKDKDAGIYLAEVEISGVGQGDDARLPVFIASLSAEGQIIARQQIVIEADAGSFSQEVSDIAYGKIDDGPKASRLLVGFVLSDAQLSQNREGWLKAMGHQ